MKYYMINLFNNFFKCLSLLLILTGVLSNDLSISSFGYFLLRSYDIVIDEISDILKILLHFVYKKSIYENTNIEQIVCNLVLIL